MSIWAGQILTPPLTGDGKIFRQVSGETQSPSRRHLTIISEYDYDTSLSTTTTTAAGGGQSMSNNNNMSFVGHDPSSNLHEIQKRIPIKTEKDNALSFFKNLGYLLHRTNRPLINAGPIDITNRHCAVVENFNTSSPIGKKTKSIVIASTGEILNSTNSNNSTNISVSSTKQLCHSDNNKKTNENVMSNIMEKCDNSKNDCDKNDKNNENRNGNGKSKGIFILPRVNLKTNSIPMCNNSESSSFHHQQCYEKPGGRERVSSHYSTDKSGSSGYYSSNIYSTSSLEDHIYSEPVNDDALVDRQLAAAGSVSVKMCVDSNGNKMRSYATMSSDQQHQGGNLVNLEKSIRDLEMHLQLFNRPTANTDVSFENCVDDQYFDRRRSERLPTIMEGADGPPTITNPLRIWQEDPDDSLIDLDLDSFLLPNEVPSKDTRKVLKTIDNVEIETDKKNPGSSKIMENNYKCTKYVNSCPDDPYQVEGVIEENHHSIDKSLAFYLKRCEDQVHYQSTKDILEDIRAKLNALLTNNSTPPATINNNPFTDNGGANSEAGSRSPSLRASIRSLKGGVENYLNIMNKPQETEIKNFYEGLTKNDKLQTIQNAFENRARSRFSDDGFDTSRDELSYEPIVTISATTQYTDLVEPMSQFETVYVRDGYSLDDYKNNSPFHFSTPVSKFKDPNFQLQRKVISTITPCSTCDGAAINSNDNQTSNNPSDQSEQSDDRNINEKVTQLQQNLALQQQIFVNGFRQSISEKDTMLEWHRNKPSIWEMYYGTNRAKQTIFNKRRDHHRGSTSIMSYPSSRPESDFTLDLPRAEQLRIKMKKEKKFRHRCRIITTFFSLVFFLLTVMVVSLILTRGKRMFGSMI